MASKQNAAILVAVFGASLLVNSALAFVAPASHGSYSEALTRKAVCLQPVRNPLQSRLRQACPKLRAQGRSGATRIHAQASAADVLKKKLPDSTFTQSDASNLVQVLSVIWKHVCEATKNEKISSTVITFGKCKALENSLAINRLVSHMDVCKDCCDSFGSEVIMTVHALGDGIAPGFEIKRIRAKQTDDDWDEEGDAEWDAALLNKYKDMLGDDAPTQEEIEYERLVKVPKDDAEVLRISRDWVDIIISDMGICPFSQSADKAGLPVGGVHYWISRVKTPEEIYQVYWDQVNYLMASEDRAVSTTLLLVPEFCIGNSEAWTSFTDTLTQPLEPLGIEKFIQLVFFHPQWVFRDGQDRIGAGGAANYARRSPFPMINILRTKQVRLAQKSIPTGLVYTQNEETLTEIGQQRLQEMLLERQWGELVETRVDRRYNKLGKIAQMLMDTDGVPPEEVRRALDQQIKDLEALRESQKAAKASSDDTPPQQGASESEGFRF